MAEHPKDVVGWHVWYDGGEYFTSADSAWDDLPADGVQVMLVLFADGTSRIASGDDWYFHRDGVYGHTSQAADLLRSLPWVKRGRWTSDAIVHDLSQQAQDVAAAHYAARQSR